MNGSQLFAETYAPSQVGLGFVVNLDTFRSVLKGLNLNGRRWWIASDHADAVDRGYITIGHGDEQ